MAKAKLKKIHHLGFVVQDLDAPLKIWKELFGVTAQIKEKPELHVRLGIIEIAGVMVVFNESTHPESRWARYLNSYGEGLEHIAVEVKNFEEAMEAAQDLELPLRYAEPKPMYEFLTKTVDGISGTGLELVKPGEDVVPPKDGSEISNQ